LNRFFLASGTFTHLLDGSFRGWVGSYKIVLKMSLHHLHMRQLSLCVQCGLVACIAVVLARLATFLTSAAGCDVIKEVKRCQLQLREWLLLHLAL